MNKKERKIRFNVTRGWGTVYGKGIEKVLNNLNVIGEVKYEQRYSPNNVSETMIEVKMIATNSEVESFKKGIKNILGVSL